MPRFIAALCAVAFALAACAQDEGAEDTSTAPSEPPSATEADEPPGAGGSEDPPDTADTSQEATVEVGDGREVVATVFPLAWMAEQVAPGAGVTFVGASGQDPHDLELSPADRQLLETADVVAYMGDIDFQPQVETAVRARTERVVDVAAVAGESRWLAFDHDDDHADDDHGHADDDHADDDHGHADDDHAGDDHGHARIDPHLWFDAGVMADVAEQMGQTFADADPDNAAGYRDNATLVAGELQAIEAETDNILSGCAHDTVMVSHEAYAYLLEPRGLEQEGISGAGGHGEASPQRLAELTERIRAENIPAVAAEPAEGRADAEALAAESGADLVEIHPLETAEGDEFETGYPQLLLDQADAFATALDCS